MARIYKLTFKEDGEDEEEGETGVSPVWQEDLFLLLVGVIIGVLSTLTFVYH